jgi:hypothetical protein
MLAPLMCNAGAILAVLQDDLVQALRRELAVVTAANPYRSDQGVQSGTLHRFLGGISRATVIDWRNW